MVAQATVNRKVGGSSPPGGANWHLIYPKLYIYFNESKEFYFIIDINCGCYISLNLGSLFSGTEK